MALLDEDIGPLTALISPERLASLQQLTGSTREAIELHQETLRLGAGLMNIIASVEIALRNAVCENLSQHFGAENWFLYPPVPFHWKEPEEKKLKAALDSARKSEYSKMNQAEKAALDILAFPNGKPANLGHLTRAKKRRAQINVTNGKVIAEVTLYFWKKLYGPDYEQQLWKTSLKRTFPYKKISRSDVAENLENIYQARNRLAHHEPVLHKRFSETMDSIQFVIEHLGTKKPRSDTPLAKLIDADLVDLRAKAQALHTRLDAFRSAPHQTP